MRLKKFVLAVDCLLLLVSLLGLLIDHGDGARVVLWITVALLASAQLWRHLTNGR